MDANPATWTDAEVEAHLVAAAAPLEGWCYSDLGCYGFCDKDGQLFACADDDDARSQRIMRFLRSIGARTIEQVMPPPPATAGPT